MSNNIDESIRSQKNCLSLFRRLVAAVTIPCAAFAETKLAVQQSGVSGSLMGLPFNPDQRSHSESARDC